VSDTGATGSRLASVWRRAAHLLGIEVVAPFVITLPSGAQLGAAVLVKRFGAPNGMLLMTDYTKVRHELNALEEAGFGFSVLEEPAEDEQFVLDEFVQMLRDWGWNGTKDDEPAWMGSA